MNRSESTSALAAALSKAQGAMRAAELNRENPFFKSRYATLASIWEAIRKPLSDNELAVTQVTYPDNGHLILETALLHSSGEWLSAQLIVKPVKDDPQGVGSAISYARRYGLSAIVGAVSDEDDDGNEASNAKKAGAAPAKSPAKPAETSAETEFNNIPNATQERGLKPAACNVTKAAGFIPAVTGMVDKLEGAGVHTGYKLAKGGYDFDHVRYSLAAEGYLTLTTEQLPEAMGKLEARIIAKAQEQPA
jgi:hypothetical protein